MSINKTNTGKRKSANSRRRSASPPPAINAKTVAPPPAQNIGAVPLTPAINANAVAPPPVPNIGAAPLTPAVNSKKAAPPPPAPGVVKAAPRSPAQVGFENRIGVLELFLNAEARTYIKKLTDEENARLQQVLKAAEERKKKQQFGQFDDLDRALDLIKKINQPSALADGKTLSKDEINELSAKDELNDIKRIWKARLTLFEKQLQAIEELIVRRDYDNANKDISQLKKDLLKVDSEKSISQEKLDKEERTRRISALGFIQDCVAKLDSEQLDAIKQVHHQLTNGQTEHTAEQKNKLLSDLVRGVFQSKALPKVVAKDPTFFANLVITAASLGVLDNDMIGKLGTNPSAVAERVLLVNCTGLPGEVNKGLQMDLHGWMWNTVALADWNDKEKGIAAQVYNALWNARQYDKICELVLKGVDSLQAHSLGQDSGRGDREGIWSGYIQPLEHVLGNYVRKVYTLTQGKLDPKEDKLKIQGAQQVLTALEKSSKASIVTNYETVKESEAMQEFMKTPGTIWGFEDVRLPYVQAARETQHGQQPLRMWEMWEAIEHALNEQGYNKLLENPDTAIPEFIKLGVDEIREEKKKNNREYDDIDVDIFIKKFSEQATNYLRFLAAQTPRAKFATAELSGKDPGKLMGALGCKAGLWWAKQNNKPLYYCLDGIKIEDALNYKVFKNKKINAYLRGQGVKHFEVITFSEIREILKNWDELKDTVKFIEKGKIKRGDALSDVDTWRKRMDEIDSLGEKRQAPKAEKYKGFLDKLNALDAQLVNWLDDHEAQSVVIKSENLKRAASAQEDMIGAYLETECALLYTYGILPVALGATYAKVRDSNEEARASALKDLKEQLERVCLDLRTPLLKRLVTPFEKPL